MQSKPITNKFLKFHWLFIFFATGLVAYFGGAQIDNEVIQILAQDIIFPISAFFFSVYSALRIVDHTSLGAKISSKNISHSAIVIMLVLFLLYIFIPHFILDVTPL